MDSRDLYAILGVQPDAEEVVIIAAYRALAKRYHPDRFSGDSDEAHKRMSQINEAYEVLGNKFRRAEYDRSRHSSNHTEFESDEDTDQTEAFNTALKDTEERWRIACSIYKDLNEYRQRLSHFSASLAFSFVVVILESKAFENRLQIAQQMERKFVERYFGSNDTIINYAIDLILSGHKRAAKALNRLVAVMGSGVEPKLLIDRIDNDFGFAEQRKRTSEEKYREILIKQLINTVKASPVYTDESFCSAQSLANELNYKVEKVGGRLFKLPNIVVKTPTNEILKFTNPIEFVKWALNVLCELSMESNERIFCVDDACPGVLDQEGYCKECGIRNRFFG